MPWNRQTQDGRLYLRDEELDAGAGLVLFAQKRLADAASEAIGTADLNRGEADLLLAIRADPGRTVTEMRRRLGMTVPTFARLLGQIDKQDLIEKARTGKDARTRLLYLSVKGKKLTEPVAEAMRHALRAAFRAAGAEHVAGMRAVLTALTEASGDE